MNLELRPSRHSPSFGHSPLVPGLPLHEYIRRSPRLKVTTVDPSNLRLTDTPGNLLTILRLSEEWVRAVQRAVDEGRFTYPPICPIVISDFGILDGNHRALAASFHTSKMPAFVVKNLRDFRAVYRLVEEGCLFWPHGEIKADGDLGELFERAVAFASMGLGLGTYRGLTGGSGVYFNSEIFGESSLKYCIGRVAFTRDLGEPRLKTLYMPVRDRRQYAQALEEEIQKNGLVDRIRKLLSESEITSRGMEQLAEKVMDFLKNPVY